MSLAPRSAPRAPRAVLLAFAAAAGLLTCLTAHADQQRDPGLKTVVAGAISQAQCFTDRFDSAVWYRLMEPRLRRTVPDDRERVEILKDVYCETHRPGETRLPPGLVMALIDVESRFDRWAVSSAGAVGLMQVMPFWPEQLGMKRFELTHVEANLRMGCAILRFYLREERHNYARALARYNGSVGHRNYSDAVLERWGDHWTGADDLGSGAQAAQAVRKSSGG
ncbi:MAG TPA: lytic transglycosylase domain-containing protein [Steroidobacteraceae bacterium]